jgi:hypothetical protein
MARRSEISLRQRCIDLSGEESLLFADGFDAAIIGFAWRESVAIVAYDTRSVIDILRKRDGMTREDAEEFFDYNIQGAWIGEATPIFVDGLSVRR